MPKHMRNQSARSSLFDPPRRIWLFRSARRFGGFAIRRQEMSQPIRA